MAKLFSQQLKRVQPLTVEQSKKNALENEKKNQEIKEFQKSGKAWTRKQKEASKAAKKVARKEKRLAAK